MEIYNVPIIILNWNNAEDTQNCINSIMDTCPIIIVDNGSKEPPRINPALSTLENSPVARKGGAHLILNDKNYGFAAGNNQGIRYAIGHFQPEYILLLNSDTIVTADFLNPLISAMQSDPEIAAVQPKILRLPSPSPLPRGTHAGERVRVRGTIDSAGQIAYGWGSVRDRGLGRPDGPLYNKREEISGACAAAVLYRVSALEDTGLFDERLFSLFEDVDLSWRLRLKGYKIMYEPDSVVYHKRGVSGMITTENRIIRRFYGFRN